LFIVQSVIVKKARLRRHVADLVAAAPGDRRAGWDRAIQARLLSAAIYHRVQVIHCYLGMHDEVATEGFVRAALAGGKRVVASVVQAEQKRLQFAGIEEYDRDLAPGYRGILEPVTARWVEAEEIELFVIPGVVFDLRGYRLGRGLGFYDRCLAEMKGLPAGQAGRAALCALAYELQVVKALPTAPHDVPVDYIVTERRVIECKGGSGKKAD
jgi:5-formyltetrahydrofolate cyclo-ligase